MAKYFKIIGWIELLAFAGGIIDIIVTMIQQFKSPLWWVLLMILVLLILVGPSLGLLFISYGNHLEEKELSPSPTPYSQKKKEFYELSEDEPKNTKSKDKSLIISTLIFSGKHKSKDIKELESLSNDQLLKLQEEAFPNKTAIPVSLELNDVSFKGDMIVIGSSYYNVECTEIKNVKMTDRILSFMIFNTQYVIGFSNAVGANQLFEELKRRTK